MLCYKNNASFCIHVHKSLCIMPNFSLGDIVGSRLAGPMGSHGCTNLHSLKPNKTFMVSLYPAPCPAMCISVVKCKIFGSETSSCSPTEIRVSLIQKGSTATDRSKMLGESHICSCRRHENGTEGERESCRVSDVRGISAEQRTKSWR